MKFWLGTEFASKSPAEQEALLRGDDEESSDRHPSSWGDYLSDLAQGIKETMSPSRAMELVIGALAPTGGGHYVNMETLKKTEPTARGKQIRDVRKLVRKYGGREQDWIKWKGEGDIMTPSGSVRKAEIHWYEHHGIAKRKVKFKKWVH